MKALYPAGLLFLTTSLWGSLSQSDRGVLQDAGGWEYLTISDANNGLQTDHVCFDEHKGRGACRGTLFLRPDMSFVQEITAEGKSSHRHGSYEWTDDGMTFADEFGTRDGPYTVQLDAQNGLLTLETTQAGVVIRTRLELEKEFHKRASDHAKH